MKKWMKLCMIGVLTLGLMAMASCGGDTGAEGKDLLETIQNKGELTVALEGAWAPWNYHDEKGALVGFDTEVAEKIGEKLGVQTKFVEGEWDGLFAGLDAGRYDIVVNGVEWTEERAEKYDFTTPYAYIRTALIVPSDNKDITSFKDLKGKNTANSINSTYMLLAEEYGAKVQGVESLNETLQMVLSGRVDATLNAEVSYYDYMKEHPEAELKIAALTEEASHVVIPVRKGENTKAFKQALDNAIQELREEGVLKELSVKYFGSDITGEN